MFNARISIFFFLIICLFTFCKPKQVAQQTVIKKEETKDTVKTLTVQPKPEIPDTVQFNLGIVMPFHFDENLAPPVDDTQEPEIVASSLPAIEFYEGAKLAADSFQTKIFKVNFKIFDSADSAKLETLVKGMRIYKNELLFTNVTNGNLFNTIKNAEKTGTHVINIQQGNLKAANLLTCFPNNQSMIHEMANYIAAHYSSYKIIVVYRDAKKEKELGDWFASQIDSAFIKNNVDSFKCTRVNYNTVKFDGLTAKLDKSKRNLIVITSSDEAFVSPLLSQLNEQSDKYKFQVCGLPTWENFETVNELDLEKSETIIFSSNFLNYDDAELKNFRKVFITKYKTDPTYQAYQGFYLIKGFIKKAKADKKYWENLTKDNSDFNPSLFNFKATTRFNGYDNIHISVMKFADFRLVQQ